MRRFRIGGSVVCSALALIVLASTPSPRPLELTASPAAARLGVVVKRSGTSLVRLDPTSLKRVGRALDVRGFAGAWSFAPDARRVAVAVRRTETASSETLRFYTVTGPRRSGRGVALGGLAFALAWLQPNTVLVGVDDPNGGRFVVAVDATSRRVVARTPVDGSLLQISRSSEALILLVGPTDRIGPARLELFGADGARRSARLDDVVAGYAGPDDNAGTSIGTRRVPGLAIDASGNRAFVVTPDGLIAVIDLGSLSVSYHRWEEQRPAIHRLAGWLTPVAEAKGINGPALTARWLGNGFLAVAGRDESAVLDGANMRISFRPLGLRIVDVTDWSASLLDSGADAFAVGDGVLLARGSSWSSDPHVEAGMGLAAYGADRARRFQFLPGQAVWIGFVYRGRAYVSLSGQTALRIVDLASGRALGTRRADAPWPLVDETMQLFG